MGNLHLLFWLSLMPFTTGWMGENHFAPLPVAIYGVGLLMCAIAYTILVRALIVSTAAIPNSRRASAATSRATFRWSLFAAIGLAFVNLWISIALFAAWR